MKKYLLSAAAVMLILGYSSLAQENDQNPKSSKDSKEAKSESKKNKLKEYDEIIIKRKDPKKDTKVVIEIKDDQVIVDGKPIDEFVDEEVSVQMRNKNIYKLRPPSSQFRFEDDDWSIEQQDQLNRELDMQRGQLDRQLEQLDLHRDQMDLYENEGEERPFLGVSTEGTTGGTRVVNVSENSAAAKAGLQKDDIITKINDKPVFDQEQLSELISELKPNDKITITYKRGGKENKTTAILGKRQIAKGPRGPRAPREPMAPIPPMNFDFEDGKLGELFQNHMRKPRLGIKVQDTEDGKGVKVLEVDEGTAADKAGIKENDIITSFEGKDVNSAEELAKASREAKEKTSMKVQLNRNGKHQTIEVKVPKKLKTANL